MSFPYNTIKKENIKCNFCGEDNYTTLSREGTDGLALNSVICKKCGLIYINPRMTKDGYKLYYEDEYRSKTINNGEKGSGFRVEKLHETTRGHGRFLGELIKKYLNIPGVIMEVGSGPGGVLYGLKEILNREVVGIEPSLEESDYANKVGIKTYHTLMEDFEGVEKYAAVVSTQSLNHYLDPKFFFTWSYNSLLENGILVLEVMNFRQQLKKAGKFKNAVKIDHVYMYTPEVLKDFVKSAGFEILDFHADEYMKLDRVQGIPRVHIRIVAKKINGKTPFKELIIDQKNYRNTLKSLNPTKVYLRYLLLEKIPRLLRIK